MTRSRLITREEFLAKPDLNPVEVPIPALGGSVWVRTMSTRQRDDYDLDQGETKTARREDIRARILVFTVCDEEGNLLFKPEDKTRISDLFADRTQPLFEEALKVNNIFKADVEEAEKNSETVPSQCSSATLPASEV
jgi:hypothetical protein